MRWSLSAVCFIRDVVLFFLSVNQNSGLFKVTCEFVMIKKASGLIHKYIIYKKDLVN